MFWSLIAGGFIAAYVNWFTAKLIEFRQAKTLAFEAFGALFNEYQFVRYRSGNPEVMVQGFFPVRIKLAAGEHFQAAADLEDLGKTIDERFVQFVRANPQRAIPDDTLLEGAKEILMEKNDSWSAAIKELKPNWAAIFRPW